MDGIKQTVFIPTSHFRWRYVDKIKTPDCIYQIPADHVVAMTELLLSITDENENNICKLIDLVTNDFMRCSHKLILDKLYRCKNLMKGNEVIVECLRKNINRHLRCKNAVWAMNAEELSCFQKLLDMIESDDLIIRNKHYFSDYFVKDDFDDIDLAKQRKESRIYRKGILENVIAVKGWDGIWELARCVGNIEGLIEALVELTGDGIRIDIYERYCAKELEVKFVRQYFRTLFYEYGESTYLQYISELKAISEEQISIVLYAPEITHEITTLVDTLPGYIQREYWSNVGLWGLTVDHSLYAIERLRNVGRYADILRLVHDKDIKLHIHSSVWLDILFEIFDNAQIDVLYKEY